VWPFTMWAADDGRVLMVNGEPPRLDIRSPAGEVLSSVHIPADMLFPLHAVEMTEQHVLADSSVNNDISYVVSHGRTDDHLHRVCKVVPLLFVFLYMFVCCGQNLYNTKTTIPACTNLVRLRYELCINKRTRRLREGTNMKAVKNRRKLGKSSYCNYSSSDFAKLIYMSNIDIVYSSHFYFSSTLRWIFYMQW